MSIHIKTNYKLHNKGIEYPLIINSTITKEENNTIHMSLKFILTQFLYMYITFIIIKL